MLRYIIILFAASLLAFGMKVLNLRFAIFTNDYRIDFHANLLLMLIFVLLFINFYRRKIISKLKSFFAK